MKNKKQLFTLIPFPNCTCFSLELPCFFFYSKKKSFHFFFKDRFNFVRISYIIIIKMHYLTAIFSFLFVSLNLVYDFCCCCHRYDFGCYNFPVNLIHHLTIHFSIPVAFSVTAHLSVSNNQQNALYLVCTLRC